MDVFSSSTRGNYVEPQYNVAWNANSFIKCAWKYVEAAPFRGKGQRLLQNNRHYCVVNQILPSFRYYAFTSAGNVTILWSTELNAYVFLCSINQFELLRKRQFIPRFVLFKGLYFDSAHKNLKSGRQTRLNSSRCLHIISLTHWIHLSGIFIRFNHLSFIVFSFTTICE